MYYIIKILIIGLFYINYLCAECCISDYKKPPTDIIPQAHLLNPYNKVLCKLIWENENGQILKKSIVWITYEEAIELGLGDYISKETWDFFIDDQRKEREQEQEHDQEQDFDGLQMPQWNMPQTT